MGGDSIRTRLFTHERSLDGIRLGSAPSLPQRCHVIDIDIQPLLLCSHCHRP
jgi:hypothetical protein